MKKIKVVYIKIPKIQVKNDITRLAEQTIFYEGDEITFNIPDGYQILTVTEVLPDVHNENFPKSIQKN